MGYDDFVDIRTHAEPRQSGIGIASFALALGAGVLLFVLFGIAGVMEATDPGGIDEKSPVAVILGLALFAGLFLDFIAIGLGIGGIAQQNRKKLFAILGVVFGCATLLLTIALVVVGLAVG